MSPSVPFSHCYPGILRKYGPGMSGPPPAPQFIILEDFSRALEMKLKFLVYFRVVLVKVLRVTVMGFVESI